MSLVIARPGPLTLYQCHLRRRGAGMRDVRVALHRRQQSSIV
jgi:hypothetical protein